MMSSRLQTIATRHRQARVRDALFATALAIAAAVSAVSVHAVCVSASTPHVTPAAAVATVAMR